MGKILNFWKRTKKEVSWKIFFRYGNELDILTNYDSSFKEFELDNKTVWAADPLAFETSKGTFLFFELFDKKKNKGVIACSEIKNGLIDNYEVVLEEDFHLSFPFVFERNGSFYMIPETGARKKVVLYKSTNFPKDWKRESVIVDNIKSSDNIVFERNNTLFLLSSVIGSTPSDCSNQLYLLNENFQVSKEICKTAFSTDGNRNAGSIYTLKNTSIRPGQFSHNNDYGKGLCFFEFNCGEHGIQEKLIKTVLPEEIKFLANEPFCGIHTYSWANGIEIIDAKVVKNRNILDRFKILVSRVLFKK